MEIAHKVVTYHLDLVFQTSTIVVFALDKTHKNCCNKSITNWEWKQIILNLARQKMGKDCFS